MNRVVPNGTLRGVEGEGQISPIRLFCGKVRFCERKRSGNRTLSAPEKKGDCGKEKEEIISKKYFFEKNEIIC